MSTIAFLGLGSMGRPMARRLVEAQHRVTGYDLNPAALTALEAMGGHAASSAAEAAKSADILILMVVNADQAETALFDHGALAALSPSATVILMATCAPGRVTAIAAKVEATGRGFIDAPVSGGVVGAEAGSLTIMAAGKPATISAHRPILETLGSKLFIVGETPGQGAMLKTVNQLLCGVHIAAAAEGLALAQKAGIDGKLALEILGGSAAASWMLNNRGPRMLEDEPVVTSAIDIFVKDLGLVLEAGEREKIGLPLAALSRQMFLQASGKGLGKADDSQVIQLYRSGEKT
ncbi:MAG: NAD(P)-dependent oxidoreductase [Beijerinckiaceae bacterium]